MPCTSSTGQLVALALAKASLDWIVIPFKGLEVKKYYKCQYLEVIAPLILTNVVVVGELDHKVRVLRAITNRAQ